VTGEPKGPPRPPSVARPLDDDPSRGVDGCVQDVEFPEAAFDEIRASDFDQFAALIQDIDEPPALDPRLAAFIDDYAKFCAELYSRGFVPDSAGEDSLLRQYLRAYDGRRSQRGGVVRAPRNKSRR
jgi:hypothetical protein